MPAILWVSVVFSSLSFEKNKDNIKNCQGNLHTRNSYEFTIQSLGYPLKMHFHHTFKEDKSLDVNKKKSDERNFNKKNEWKFQLSLLACIFYDCMQSTHTKQMTRRVVHSFAFAVNSVRLLLAIVGE